MEPMSSFFLTISKFVFLYRMGLSLVKTTSLTSPLHRTALKSTQQQSRKPLEQAGASVFRRGYDGLGGHTKFLAPSRPTKAASRKIARPSAISKFIKQTKYSHAEPPLPVMDLDSTWKQNLVYHNIIYYRSHALLVNTTKMTTFMKEVISIRGKCFLKLQIDL